MVLKGSTSLFEFMKVILTQNIETIRDFGGTDQAASLELIVEDLEKDVSDRRHLNSSDLTPFVKQKVKRRTSAEDLCRDAKETGGRVPGVEIPGD